MPDISAWKDMEFKNSSVFDLYSTIEPVSRDIICGNKPNLLWLSVDSDLSYEVAKKGCQNLGNGNFPELDWKHLNELKRMMKKIDLGILQHMIT